MTNPFAPVDMLSTPAPVAPAPRYGVSTRDLSVNNEIVSDPAYYGNYTHVVVVDRETGETVASYSIGESFDERDAAHLAARADVDRLNRE